MSRSLASIAAAVAKDILSPRPVTYLVIIRSKHILFARNSGNSSKVLLQTEDESLGLKELCPEFFKLLQSHESYYGQPITILIDSSRAFTYIREYSEFQPAILKEKLQELRSDRTVLNFATKQMHGSTIVIIQGIDKEFLELLSKETELRGLPVVSVTTLAGYLAMNSKVVGQQNLQLHLMWWAPGQYTYLGMTSEHSIFSGAGEVSTDASAEHILGQIKHTFFGDSEPVTVVSYYVTTAAQKRGLSIASVFKRGHVFSGASKPLARTISPSRTARIFCTALNSIKLLLVVLSALTAVAAATAIKVGSTSQADPEIVARYQDLYTRKSELQYELDSLRNVESSSPRKALGVTNAAALFSLFCQDDYPGLSLNSISLKRSNGDSVIVEASGIARGESVIFRYSKDLNALSSPVPVAISSFRPEVINVNGTVDTVLNFRLGMVMYEKQSDK